jgi:peptidoglycan/xylan/chitin deacetylase (PgdA/CDA1 family)
MDAPVPVEVHPHSHTHPPRDQADLEFEVARSIEEIRSRFATDPLGYRLPNGTIRPEDYAVLDAYDVDFDASLFPSLFPGRFNNLGYPQQPFRHNSGLLEIPFTVYSPALPVPYSLSYLKLLGQPIQTLLRHNPPETIVFDMHLHDYVSPSTYRQLSRPYRFVYGRNRDSGPAILRSTLEAFEAQGYEFERLSKLYAEVDSERPL